MSLFKKFFSADPEALEKKADALFESGDFGPAKLAYEKAIAAAPESSRAALTDKVEHCTNGIARQRIDEAKAYLDQSMVELAAHELEGALEVAIDESIQREARELLDGLEAKAAQSEAAAPTLSDEERVALLMGQWQDAQADEYDEYGDALLDALVAMHKENLDEALPKLEALLEDAPSPRYLWLEVGRARLLADDVKGGKEALERFLDALDDDGGGETRLVANLTLARLADDDGDFEGATRYFDSAVQALPDDYRPYLAMGAFLRDKGHGEEAVEVLRTSLELSKTSGTDWRLLEELGLAHELAGKPEEAQKFLEQVIEFFRNHEISDYPPTTATALARVYEADGRLDRAADMYRALSQGSDREQHALYHFEAGRLLRALELEDEAHRMLTRAKALTGDDDAELGERIAALLQD